MRRRLAEQSVIFFSILKWFVLATVTGAIVGLSTALFLKLLNWSTIYCSRYTYYYLLVPIALFTSALMIKYLAPDAEGHGTEKVIEAVHKNYGKIKPMVVPIKLAATIITLALGGSAGKEGPCAQIGGGLASIFADLLKLDNHDRKKLVICGISAGFAAVFGTPIAGSIFAIEVLFVGSILYEVLLPSFIAGITAYQISYHLGIRYFYHQIDFVPVFSEAFFIKVALAGVFFGICSFLLVEALNMGKKVAERLKVWIPLKGLIGGFILIGLTLIFSKHYLGLGLETIQDCLQGTKQVWYAFFLKIIYTSITLNFGGSGGIVTPIFFIGSTSGSFFAGITGLDIATFSAIGLVSLLAGAANTPISASIMAVELFGPKIAPYAAVACVISFLMTGHRSVYPSQVLAITKSESIHAQIGKEVEMLETEFNLREKGFIQRGLKIVDKMKKRFNKNKDKS
jgi:chloride channel protein, CIC family